MYSQYYESTVVGEELFFGDYYYDLEVLVDGWIEGKRVTIDFGPGVHLHGKYGYPKCDHAKIIDNERPTYSHRRLWAGPARGPGRHDEPFPKAEPLPSNEL